MSVFFGVHHLFFDISVQIATSDLRATVLTASGKIATFVDDLLLSPQAFKDDVKQHKSLGLISYAERWEHPALVDAHFVSDNIVQISVSNTITIARTASGRYQIAFLLV